MSTQVHLLTRTHKLRRLPTDANGKCMHKYTDVHTFTHTRARANVNLLIHGQTHVHNYRHAMCSLHTRIQAHLHTHTRANAHHLTRAECPSLHNQTHTHAHTLPQGKTGTRVPASHYPSVIKMRPRQ